MRYQLFQYALPAPPDLSDLNEFLASHKIASVQHHVVATTGGAQLVFIVQSQAGSGAGFGGSQAHRKPESRIDYRAVLSPADFAVYSKLRDERRKVADAEGVPIYTVFSNAQLAEMVTRKAKSPADLAAIDGIGQARIDRYAGRMLVHLTPTP